MHLIIYTPKLTPRIKYIFNFIFKDILNTEIEFTNTPADFLASEHIKISYADKPLGKELFFKSSAFLSSQKVETLTLKTVKFGDYSIPFEVENSAFPFDIFATSFFIITRYEEYLHKEQSKLEFTAKLSYQYKWKILDKPIIDEWALMIKNMLIKKHPEFKFIKRTFFAQQTVNFSLKPDVPKGIISKTKYIFRSIVSRKEKYLSSFFDDSIGLGTNREAIIADLDAHANSKDIIYFVGFLDGLDDTPEFQNSLPLLKNKTIGLLRPSLPEFKNANALKTSVNQLKKVYSHERSLISQQIEALKIPSCYLHLLSNGITSDYSMGYNSTLGFRAGTCTPFYWYDLQLDRVTSLNVKSYCINDLALQKLDPEKINETIKDFIVTVELVKGHFYGAWQLRSLSENANFKKLKSAFNMILKYTNE